MGDPSGGLSLPTGAQDERRHPQYERPQVVQVLRRERAAGIEQAMAKTMASGAISGTEAFPAKVTIEIAGLKLRTEFTGMIALQ